MLCSPIPMVDLRVVIEFQQLTKPFVNIIEQIAVTIIPFVRVPAANILRRAAVCLLDFVGIRA